jgi:hypothetical protein
MSLGPACHNLRPRQPDKHPDRHLEPTFTCTFRPVSAAVERHAAVACEVAITTIQNRWGRSDRFEHTPHWSATKLKQLDLWLRMFFVNVTAFRRPIMEMSPPGGLAWDLFVALSLAIHK